MSVITIVLAAGAFVAWLAALLSGVAMLKHRAPGVTVAYLAAHGVAFFDASKFTPAALPHRRRLVVAFVAFFVFTLASAAVALVRARGG
jgi:hypothetical protein